MFNQLSEAVSNYLLLKEVIPAPGIGELSEQTHGHKPYAHFLPILTAAFLFVRGLSLIGTNRICTAVLIAASAVIGIAVQLHGVINRFKKSGTTAPEKNAEPMDEDQFWTLVEESLAAAPDDGDAQVSFLAERLASLSSKDIIGFRLRTDRLLYDSYKSRLWCAAYLANGGCSDDGFEYFRLWLISRGRDTFRAVCGNPDELVRFAGDDELELEDLWYVANIAFKTLTGKDLYDYIDDSFTTREGRYPDIALDWSEDEPETMRTLCPRLYAKVHGDGSR